MNSGLLAGKTALVTGSTQGIGLGIARGLEQAGCGVLYHGLEAEPEEIPKGSRYFQANLEQEGASSQLMRRAIECAPELDLLVCNAGSFFDLPFFAMTEALWNRTMELNLRPAFFLTQAFAGHLIETRRKGAVLIVASTNALQGETGSAAYDASKGGLAALTRAMALDLATHDIRVNGLAPGVVRTPLTRRWIDTQESLREHYERTIPLGRLGEPEDCAGAAVFLLSDASEYITGQVLAIDGGLTAQQIGPHP